MGCGARSATRTTSTSGEPTSGLRTSFTRATSTMPGSGPPLGRRGPLLEGGLPALPGPPVRHVHVCAVCGAR
eukprot:1121572-Alexandrium_andersonii.AAC.1